MSSAACPPHHWMLEGQNGPTSAATCKKCGAARTFDPYRDSREPQVWR